MNATEFCAFLDRRAFSDTPRDLQLGVNLSEVGREIDYK
jgi:hypothetical protein